MTRDEMLDLFDVEGFGHDGFSYICIVRRKADGARGTLEFGGMPRTYYNFMEV